MQLTADTPDAPMDATTNAATDAGTGAVAPVPAASSRARRLGGIVAAALALPGVLASPDARADADEGLVALRMLHYQDRQPGLDRITVNAPSAHVFVPFAEHWSLDGTAVLDNLSGATPRWHTAVSSASTMHESRHAYETRLTRQGERSSVSVGVSRSSEHDYLSQALSLGASLSSADNNTTLDVGVGGSNDTVNPVNQVVSGARKRTREAIVSLTQAVSPDDLVQASVGVSRGKGYFNDPYKMLDQRPDLRRQVTTLLRWNHFSPATGGTLRASYRWYRDSWGIRAHTLQGEWVQPLGERFTATPMLRLYSQSAATFYFDPVYDPVLGEPYPVGYDPNNPPALLSADPRLSAFGAVGAGLRLRWSPDGLWGVELEGQQYEQRGSWRVGGRGSPGLAPFSATFVQVGVDRKL